MPDTIPAAEFHFRICLLTCSSACCCSSRDSIDAVVHALNACKGFNIAVLVSRAAGGISQGLILPAVVIMLLSLSQKAESSPQHYGLQCTGLHQTHLSSGSTCSA